MHDRPTSRAVIAAMLITAGAGGIAACSSAGDAPGTDSAAGSAAQARADSVTGDWAIDDADQQFLRIMADHEAGMVGLARTAAERASDSLVRTAARDLATRHAAEQAEMLGLLRSTFGDAHSPMAMPAAKAAEDSLRQAPSDEVARAFRESALAHLRGGLVVIDRYAPTLSRAQVREVAERLAPAQKRGAADLEQHVLAP